MAYGLKCFDASGYITFDTTLMSSYLKVSASGEVFVAGSSTSAAITANEVDYIYIWAGEVTSFNGNTADTYEIIDRTTNSFKIKNLRTTGKTFAYIAFTR